MAIGHRLRAIDSRVHGGLITVGITWKVFSQPYKCPTCMVEHPVKTLHFNLESDGTCIVSNTVYETLKSVGAIRGTPTNGPDVAAGFAVFDYENAVNNPPSLRLGMGRGGNMRQIRQRQTIHIDYNGE